MGRTNKATMEQLGDYDLEQLILRLCKEALDHGPTRYGELCDALNEWRSRKAGE